MSNDIKNINNQSDEVRDYFKKICDEDEHGLDLEFFFKRVLFSIKKNGTVRTATFYDLSIEILESVKTGE